MQAMKYTSERIIPGFETGQLSPRIQNKKGLMSSKFLSKWLAQLVIMLSVNCCRTIERTRP